MISLLALLVSSFTISYALFSLGAWLYCEGFNSASVAAKLDYKPQWATTAPPHLAVILNQPFAYLDKGSQTFVFESNDGNWILKLFRMNRFKATAYPPPFLSAAYQKKIVKKHKAKEQLFDSCHIAYTQLKEECALYYVHLNPTNHLKTYLSVFDRLGRICHLDADQTAFVIQRKATSFYDYLYPLIQKQAYVQIEQALLSFSYLLFNRFSKGIADHDPVIEKNAGFLNNRPIFLDTGQFYFDESIRNQEVMINESQKITYELRQWLTHYLPSQADSLAECLKF